jgi:hypothetical protein
MEPDDLYREIDRLRAIEADLKADAILAGIELARLRAALADMVEISQRNSEASLMLIAIRKCAEHALAAVPAPSRGKSVD